MIPTGHHHYVPVLKVKDGEKRALRQLPGPIAAVVTPLLEIVRRTDKPIGKHLDTAFKGLDKAVSPFQRYFLDCREIEGDGAVAAATVFARAAALGKPFIPVTSVSRSVDVAAALAHRAHGIGLRLSREEFEAGTLTASVSGFLSKHGVSPSEVDVIIDLGAVDQMIVPGVEALAEQFLADVPHLGSWRSLILSACGFPRSLAGVKADSNGTFDRVDWRHWHDCIFSPRASLARLPTYSDCGIQHRDGVEGIDFSKIKPAAAIRQTCDASWHVDKGRSIRDHGGDQFQTLASNVVTATHAVAAHCAGCDALHRASSNPNGMKSLGKWREYGTIHHITLTVERLASLPFP